MAKIVSFNGSVTTFRTLGTAATPHNLFTIENSVGSPVLVGIQRLIVLLDASAVLITVMPLVKISRPAALPTGGTVLAKGIFDTNQTPSESVIFRGANASDGGGATAITASPATIMWQQYCMRLHTAVGQVLSLDKRLMPELTDIPIILRANESLLVQMVAAAAGDNPATNHWVVLCAWEEFTIT